MRMRHVPAGALLHAGGDRHPRRLSPAHTAEGYLQKLPSGAIEEHRTIERERIADLRTRLWAEMNGRPDPKDPSKIRKPSPKVMGDLIDSAIRLSPLGAMILGMDVQPRDALAAAVHNGLTIDDIRELVELYHKNTATLKKAIDVTPGPNTDLAD
jgi:hypothetical protein